MITQEQYLKEKRNEAEFNRLFDNIAQYSPFGKWYGYMIMASNALTKNLPKQIAIDETGRPIVVYKGQLAKIAGVWGTATHKAIADDLSKGNVFEALGDLLGGGHIRDMIVQNKKYKEVYDIDPKDVTRLWAAKVKQTAPPSVVAKIEQLEKNTKIEKFKSYTLSKNPYVAIMQVMFRGLPKVQM